MVEYDPFTAEAMTDPYPRYRELRAAGPVHPLPRYDTYALPRFAEVWEVSQDRTHFSIFEGPVFARERLLQHHDAPPAPDSGARPLASFSTLDPPQHTALRQAMFPAFTPHRCRSAAEAVDQIVGDQLDALRGRSEFDAVKDCAGPIATRATLLFLGLPEADADMLGPLINASTRRDPGVPGTSPDGARAREQLHAYLTAAVRAQRLGGAAAPIRQLCEFAPALDDAEIATQVTTLLVGGAETLPKIVAAGLVRLAQHPDQRDALIAQPELTPNAFEEMVRLEGVLQFIGRTALAPVTIGGQPIRPGQRVLLLLQSANRDEREFDDPDSFSIHRAIRRHVGFGHGVHFCIGAHQARLVGVALLRQLLARFPRYTVDLDRAERPPSEFQIGLTSLPLRPEPAQKAGTSGSFH